LNTDSGKSKKVFSLKPESVFKLNQNRCSDWFRKSVQVEPEYALLSSVGKVMVILDVQVFNS
jgi:hypothetical protein